MQTMIPAGTQGDETTTAVHGHIPELDGLRGVAVSMVIIGHGTGYSLVAVAGVGLFFVLSGFLITRILIRSARKRHYFTNFYMRRALRIWPLYYLIVAVAFLTPLFTFSHLTNPAYRYVFYIQNFWPMTSAPPLLGPTWSLAIEEQFYLVWPLVVWISGTPRRISQIAAVLILLTPVVRVLYATHRIDPYAATFGRMDGLAMGAALATLSISSPGPSRRKATFLIICLAVAGAFLPLLHYTLLRKAFKDTATSLVFVALVGFAFFWTGSRMTALLRNSALRYMGKISYCAYLIHLSLIYRFRLPVSITLTLIIATLSWHLFEQPILRLKDRLTRIDPV
jgi:peptidoglycan/LPS O-acetylase OafA/YrhL